MHRVMALQLPEQIRTAPLHREQQEREEIKQRETWVYAGLGLRRADLLRAETAFLFLEPACEEEQGLVGGAYVAGEEVW